LTALLPHTMPMQDDRSWLNPTRVRLLEACTAFDLLCPVKFANKTLFCRLARADDVGRLFIAGHAADADAVVRAFDWVVVPTADVAAGKRLWLADGGKFRVTSSTAGEARVVGHTLEGGHALLDPNAPR